MVLRAKRSDIGILLIDVQPFFVDLAFADREEEGEALMLRLEHLLRLADWMSLPTITTFEKPTEDNGELPGRLDAVFPAAGIRHTKNYYGCVTEPEILASVEQQGVGQWAVAGAETDVCVLQSTLGLLEHGYEVFLLEDCLFTTEPEPGPALRRMYRAGAVPSTLKTFAYELAGCVDATPWYPELWTGDPDSKPFPEDFVVPEEWPEWHSAL
jgi:nicotinamidase-related amidase